jgi:hypothetical protein
MEMECRSKPKTQYGNAVPMTLNAFHQSAPELGASNKGIRNNQSHLSNASWDQVWNINQPRSFSEHSEASRTNMISSESDDSATYKPSSTNHLSRVMNSSISEYNDHFKILEAARAAILRGESLSNTNIQTLAQQILSNRRAAVSMGHSLIGSNSVNSGLSDDRQSSFHGLSENRPLTARSKTTPSNLKFMEQPNDNSIITAQSDNLMSTMRNESSTFVPMDSNLGYQQRNPFLEQINVGGHSTFNIPTVQNSIGLSSGSMIDPLIAAELQAMQVHHDQNVLQNIKLTPDLQTLRLIQLLGGQTSFSDDMAGNILLQNQMENRFQNEVRERIRMQNEVERLRHLQQVQNEVDRQLLQEHSDAARAFLEKLARNGTNSFGS